MTFEESSLIHAAKVVKVNGSSLLVRSEATHILPLRKASPLQGKFHFPTSRLDSKTCHSSHYELLKIRSDVLFGLATSRHTSCSDLTYWSNTLLLFDKFAVFSEALANQWHQIASVWTSSKTTVITFFQLGKCQSDVLDRLRNSLLFACLLYLDVVMTCHRHACKHASSSCCFPWNAEGKIQQTTSLGQHPLMWKVNFTISITSSLTTGEGK